MRLIINKILVFGAKNSFCVNYELENGVYTMPVYGNMMLPWRIKYGASYVKFHEEYFHAELFSRYGTYFLRKIEKNKIYGL